MRMNPVPVSFGEPVQNPRNTITQGIIIVRAMNQPADQDQDCQNAEADGQRPPKPALQLPAPGKRSAGFASRPAPEEHHNADN